MRSRFPWPEFAFLIVTAIVYYYAGKLILFVAAIVGIVRVWWWANERFPRTMFCVNAFLTGLIRGLLSGRRRRW